MNTVLVTGIGGIVGQGILRNIRDFDPLIRIAGTNVISVSSGNYLCDVVYTVPYAYDENYISSVRKICEREPINLIIPSTDYESYYLALNKTEFSCAIATSPANVTHFCLDKYLNAQAFGKFQIPFAKSFLPSNYQGQFERIIVKPREGRGSRNIYLDPPKPESFDDGYVVQEYLEGPELTTTFYVTKTGSLHGHITFVRELESGNTVKAEVVFDYDQELEILIRKILGHYHFRGSCNIQSRVTTKGIIPFEINCRISGTNSVRSQFGFKDVTYTIEEQLLNRQPSEPVIVKGSALRVTLDIIYTGIALDGIKDNKDQYYIH